MKINEFGAPKKLEEGLVDTLIGGNPLTALRGAISGKGTTNTLTQDAFIKDFVQDAITSISNGLSGKFIDPKKTMTTPSASPTAAAQFPAGTKAASSNTPDQEFGKVVGAMRAVQSGTKPLPATMTASINKDIQNARYNKDWATTTGNKIINLAQKGYDVSELKNAWDSVTAIGKKQGTVQENTYQRLDAIFESIMEATDPNQPSGNPSIGDYLYDWFNQYMSGVNWHSKEAQIIPYIQAIEKGYNPVTKSKGAITQLAKVAFALSKAYGTSPRGAQNATPKTPAATSDIDTQIATLAKDPKVAAAIKQWAAKNA